MARVVTTGSRPRSDDAIERGDPRSPPGAGRTATVAVRGCWRSAGQRRRRRAGGAPPWRRLPQSPGSPDENLPALRPPACRRSDRLGRSCEQGRCVTGITRADSASEIRSSAGGKFQSTCNAEDLGHAPPRNSCRYDNSRAGGFPTVLRAPGLRRAGGGPLENPSLPARPHSRAGYPCAFCGQSDGPHEASSPRQDTNPLVPKRGNLSRADRLHAQHPANQGRPPGHASRMH